MSQDPFGGQPQGLRQPGRSMGQPQSGSIGGSPDPQIGGSEYGSSDNAAGSKSPLAMGLGFLKGLGSSSGDKKNRDGQPPKRRGPKPDSKPALTRRQELNRQAQRTHRERKEFYIKSLEQEVLQLKEVYTGTIQEKNAAVDENQKLKELLRLHGISPESAGISQHPTSSSGSRSATNFGSFQGSGYGSLHPTTETSPGPFGSPDFQQDDQNQRMQGQIPQQGSGLDYDQLGVDFVLASVSQSDEHTQHAMMQNYPLHDPRSHYLEAACMDHTQLSCVKSLQEPEHPPGGHAMMISAPTFSHIDNLPDVRLPHKGPDVPNADLIKLLTLSQDLPLDGEITPVMALNLIRNHPRFLELSLPDFDTIKTDLARKTRCYGFGAVLEEFELRDALSGVFATKLQSYSVFQ